jgi:dGTP triphosphohydrolase
MFNEDVMKYKEDHGKKVLSIKTKSAEGKLYALISSNYKRAFDCEENEVPIDPYQRFQLAVDHVSGMTDSYIVDLYNELTNRKR